MEEKNSGTDKQMWLFKVEPSSYAWETMIKDKVTGWDGVRNHQAQKYLKSMKENDLGFFYHTEKVKAIVGIVQVCKEYYYKDDPKFGLVDVEYVEELKKPVTLAEIKQNVNLIDMPIVRQPRLSICPVSVKQWDVILKLSESE